MERYSLCKISWEWDIFVVLQFGVTEVLKFNSQPFGTAECNVFKSLWGLGQQQPELINHTCEKWTKNYTAS